MRRKRNKKGNVLAKVIYAAGTLALIIMLYFTVTNFIRDARVLNLP